MTKILLQVPEQSESVTLDCRTDGQNFSIELNETRYEGSWVLTALGEGWLNSGGRVLPFYMTRKQDNLSIWLAGKTYSLTLVNRNQRATGATAHGALQSGEIKAPMPGTVLKVPVKPGDTVEANQPLVIMESMKMEMTLSAPEAATVQAVHCSEGQLVDMGTVLVKLDV